MRLQRGSKLPLSRPDIPLLSMMSAAGKPRDRTNADAIGYWGRVLGVQLRLP
jgi:hypothetical protein